MLMNALDRIFIYWDINYTTSDKFTCAEFVVLLPSESAQALSIDGAS